MTRNQPAAPPSCSRRQFVSVAAAGGVAASAASSLADDDATAANDASDSVDGSRGRLKQSVCKWCFPKMSLEDLCVVAKKLGMVGIDLLKPDQFATVKKHGLVCTMVSGHSLTNGLCDPKHQRSAIDQTLEAIEAASEAGFRNVICFSGNARGIDRQTGMKNCVEALKEITPVAEKKNVVVQMELLNSKVNHADYMCDNSTWGVELCKRVASDSFKLLYDIYHMQIMEGDIIRTIERDHKYFGHYHTAGNPGRHELDDTQELYYPPIAKAIAATGFDGYFAHEFLPTRDPVAGLTAAVRQCTV